MPAAETPAGSAVLRRVLGRYLRGLRKQARLTTKAAAGLLEWSEPKLWRIETGQTAMRAWTWRRCARSTAHRPT